MANVIIDANYVIAVATAVYVFLTALVVYLMFRQTRAQKEAVKFQRFHMLAIRMEDVREQRHAVRDYVRESKSQQGKVVFPLPDEVRNSTDKVCREFDYMGLLDRTEIVDSRLIDSFYAVPFALLYEDILGEYVAELRKPDNRSPTHFWELVQFYERIKSVPKNHPGLSGKVDWPKDARRALSHHDGFWRRRERG